MVKLIEPVFVIVRLSVDVVEYLSPLNPEVPDVPAEPDEPVAPLEPVAPDEPELPDVPAVPAVPAVPVEPVNPDVPEVPAAICDCKYVRFASISAAVSGVPLVVLRVNAILYYILVYFVSYTSKYK
jgi:hypothetical protein